MSAKELLPPRPRVRYRVPMGNCRWLMSLAVATALAFACGEDTSKQEGEVCVASSECGTGLTCDFGVSPAVCRPTQTPRSDAVVEPAIDSAVLSIDATPSDIDAPMRNIDAAAPDAAMIDAAGADAMIDAPMIDAAGPDAT